MSAAENGHATYLYCAVQSGAAPLPRRAGSGRLPHGLDGMTPPRALHAGPGLWLIAAGAPLDRYNAAAIEAGLRDLDWVSRCALAHESVVEHCARRHPVVPMKLFTLFATEERAVAHVTRTRKTLERLFARVARRDEWGVRLTLDERRALTSLPTAPRPARATGTGFLLRKKAEKDAARALLERAATEADRLYETLARGAVESRRRTPEQGRPPMRVLLDAAFLVESRRARTFKAAVASTARALAGRGLELTLSGPWPPYNFVADA